LDKRGPIPRRANPLLSTGPPVRARVSTQALTGFGVAVLAMSTYCGYLYASYQREVEQSRYLRVPEDVSDRFNRIAPSYDSAVDLGERLMRLGKRRKELVQMAHGDVLEVSCGTGRNMKYYQLGERRGVDGKGKAKVHGCRSLTFVDLSPDMIDIAQKKFEALYPNFRKVTFVAQNAREVVPSFYLKGKSTPARPITLPSASNTVSWTTSQPYFDTVLETMGLCSTPDPVGLLRHLEMITEPERGQILLLEHGRSHYIWLNNILDNLAAAHADRYGCWWNRDIGRIVEESGLEIIEIKRWHLGTTWRVILRPNSHRQERDERVSE